MVAVQILCVINALLIFCISISCWAAAGQIQGLSLPAEDFRLVWESFIYIAYGVMSSVLVLKRDLRKEINTGIVIGGAFFLGQVALIEAVDFANQGLPDDKVIAAFSGLLAVSLNAFAVVTYFCRDAFIVKGPSFENDRA
ncbi:Uncharacterized protein PBTT_01867 [Plasmodiophora brassicae]